MAADGCWGEPSREQPPAEARGPIKVPLLYHQDRGCIRFLEGCPANHAALLPDWPAWWLKGEARRGRFPPDPTTCTPDLHPRLAPPTCTPWRVARSEPT